MGAPHRNPRFLSRLRRTHGRSGCKCEAGEADNVDNIYFENHFCEAAEFSIS